MYQSGMTVTQIAEQLKLSPGYVKQMVTGKRVNPIKAKLHQSVGKSRCENGHGLVTKPCLACKLEGVSSGTEETTASSQRGGTVR